MANSGGPSYLVLIAQPGPQPRRGALISGRQHHARQATRHGGRLSVSASCEARVTEEWASALRQGNQDRAWDLFIERYRRLVFAAIRHYTTDPDDVMEVFAAACEHLRADDMRRLRSYLAQPSHQARFTTWLVTVIRHLTIDWIRHRDGRHRVPTMVEQLPPLQRRMFELVFLQGRSHTEAYELLRTAEATDLSYHTFVGELRSVYRAAGTGPQARAWVEAARPTPAEPPDPGEGQQEMSERADLRRLVGRVLDGLPPDARLTIELYVIEGLPAEQVATVVGLPNAKAVYNRVYRTLADVRERLEAAGVRREDLW